MEGLPVAPFMDRDKVTKPTAQIGFIKFVLIPMFDTVAKVGAFALFYICTLCFLIYHFGDDILLLQFIEIFKMNDITLAKIEKHAVVFHRYF